MANIISGIISGLNFTRKTPALQNRVPKSITLVWMGKRAIEAQNFDTVADALHFADYLDTPGVTITRNY